jgi:hypothetical protein
MTRKTRTRLGLIAASLICSGGSGTSIAADSASPGMSPGATPAGPCSPAEFRQFDFWAGQWEVADGAGKLVGHNTITIEEQGCVLVERWTSVAGNTGLSVNFYDPLAKTWTQQWIGLGSLLRMSGQLRDGAMVLEGPIQYLGTGKVTRLRGTWTTLPDGRVRQHFEESSDEGRTWQEWFDGYYRRKSAL